MFEAWRGRVLTLLKVPPEPHPPAGDPASLRVFRAGRNYYRLRMAGWAVTQVLALAAIVFWTSMLVHIEMAAREQAEARKAAREANRSEGADENVGRRFEQAARSVAATAERETDRARRDGHPIMGWYIGYRQALVEIAILLPWWAFGLVWALKILGILAYLVQLPLTYAVRRLDFEMRWYMVTDRSLRLRYGVWKVSESTMSFANIQQVVVSQGPLQRVLGLGDVKVTSAGGGGGKTDDYGKQVGEDMHTGLFHSVANAAEIRDLILERLRRFRASGLGDPDDVAEHAVEEARLTDNGAPDEVRAATQEVLAEAKALRAAV